MEHNNTTTLTVYGNNPITAICCMAATLPHPPLHCAGGDGCCGHWSTVGPAYWLRGLMRLRLKTWLTFHALCIKRPLLWAEAYSTLEAFRKPQQIAPNVFSEDALATITFTFIWWFRSLENKPQHCQPHKTSTWREVESLHSSSAFSSTETNQNNCKRCILVELAETQHMLLRFSGNQNQLSGIRIIWKVRVKIIPFVWCLNSMFQFISILSTHSQL